MDEDEYFKRSQTLVPSFTNVLPRLANLDMALVHVTSPFDIPIPKLESDISERRKWTGHVLNELLSHWQNLPFSVCGFSGGAALALNGIHESPMCIGGAILGPDAIPDCFNVPNHWSECLQIFCSRTDQVCNAPSNKGLIQKLVHDEKAEAFFDLAGGHSLSNYADQCFADLFRISYQLYTDFARNRE